MLTARRGFHLSACTRIAVSSSLMKSNAFQQAGFMARIMRKNTPRAKSKGEEFGLLPLGIVPKTSTSVVPQRLNYRRASNLNKVFMQHITDFMSSRFLCEKTGDLLVEVNRVETSPDFQSINVFYISRSENEFERLQTRLNEAAGILRHEMSQLKVVGFVPKINFILDKKYLKMMEVEKLLKIADIGEAATEESNEEDPTVDDIDVPMSYSVYGLNHPEITERIKQRKRLAKKSKEDRTEVMNLESSPEAEDLTSSPKEIKQFLRSRGKI